MRRKEKVQNMTRGAMIDIEKEVPYLPTLGHKHYRGTLDQLGPDALLG